MAAAADSRTVSLATPAKAEYVVLARLALSAVCRLTPLAPDEVADLKLAITEAAALLVGAEEADDDEGRLDFDFTLDDDRLVLEIAGPPQTGATARVSDQEQELSHAIIRATADESDYRESSVRLVKYVNSSPE
jgi:anti-sigma regulatory factor (Ser/Thr protein kinase)